ncbi:MAG: chrA1 [Haloplasmataceae bacterium]|nr:chrA1 [Haloplasmataceae bacterium]
MIPLIEREILAKKWVDKKDITDTVAIAQSLPGAVAINMALLVGYRIRRIPGAIVAALGSVLPSFIIIVLIAMVFTNFQDNLIVQKAFLGVRAAVVALILEAAIRLGKDAVYDLPTLLITTITVVLLIFLPINPIYIIISGVLVGILFYFVYPKKVKQVENRTVGKDE